MGSPTLRRLVFPDEGAVAAARARSAPGDVIFPLVSREQDLRTYPELSLTAADFAAVATQSAAAISALGERLRDSLPPSGDGLPEFWACFAEHFRSWAAAPLLANAQVARCAAAAHPPQSVLALEDPTRASWWACRQQAAEAVASALPALPIIVRPGRALRAVRRWLGPALARRSGRALLRAESKTWSAIRDRFPEPEPADVLFLPIGGTCVPIVDRIVSHLASTGLRAAALMADAADLGMEGRASEPVPYQFIAHFHRNVDVRALQPLCEGLRTAAGDRSDPVGAAIALRLLITLARDAERLLADRQAALRILDAYQPRVVVAFHLYWHRIAPIILAARVRGVPVIYAQHGVYLAQDECIWPLPYDQYLVFGQGAADTISGKPLAGPVIPVGHSLYDDLLSAPAGPTRGKAIPTVLIATQPDETQVYDVSSERWWLRGVVQACHELGARALIKLHPREADTAHYDTVRERWPDTVQVLRHSEGALPALLAEADVLVTRDSTVVFEGNLLGVPVITVNLTGQRDRFPFAADGGAIGVYDYEALPRILGDVLTSGAPALSRTRPAFIARHLGPGDGKATQRIVQAITGAARSSMARN
jgi:hypothetical protein